VKPSSRKLIYVCPEYPGVVPDFGGIGVSMRQEAQWFASRGYDVSVICRTDEASPGQRLDEGVKVSVLGGSNIPKLRAILDRVKVADECRRMLSGSRGLVICPDYAGPLWFKRFGQPLIVQLHGCGTLNSCQQGKKIDGLVKCSERRTVGLADAIQSCSRFTAKRTGELLGFDARECEVIHHPVDHKQFFPDKSAVKAGDILFVGKFSAIKGVFTLAEAVAEVFRNLRAARLLMVGGDTFEQGESVREKFLGRIPAEFHDRVKILGRRPRSEVARMMRSAAAAVFPSKIEAFPLVLLEAMSSGRPVVASARGGIPEIVVGGVNGLLADPDAPATFAQALLTLLKNPRMADAIGAEARRLIVAEYTPDRVYAKTEEFHSLVCRRPGASPSKSPAPAVKSSVGISQ
jgi:glycosyltransferase involved in cell wall biosynthesis